MVSETEPKLAAHALDPRRRKFCVRFGGHGRKEGVLLAQGVRAEPGEGASAETGLWGGEERGPGIPKAQGGRDYTWSIRMSWRQYEGGGV